MNKNSSCPFILHSWWEITSHFLITCAINFYSVSLFGIQGKLHFSQILLDASRSTSTQLRLSETEDKHCKKAFFFSSFSKLYAHWGWLYYWKSIKINGLFCQSLWFFIYFFLGLIFATTSKWNIGSTMIKVTNDQCLSLLPPIPHHVRINPEWGDCSVFSEICSTSHM